MTKKFFDKTYAEYWEERTNENSSDTKVPHVEVAQFFLKKMNLKNKDIVLDLGCGHGRLYPVLSRFSKNIIGVEPNKEAIKEIPIEYSYNSLVSGSAEKTNLQDAFFDKIVAWATYDVVSQERALVEENRILKIGGLFLMTGKNRNYQFNDKEAFIAERNAKLKNFPNHFTDVYGLINKSQDFGFKVIKAFGFSRRGDWANLKYFNIISTNKHKFYEFLLILEKKENINSKNILICQEFSETAIKLARKSGFEDTMVFLKWHKEKYDN